MRIMIAGGGTGGHTSPAVAVIEELERRDPRLAIQWIGRRGGIEERICERLAVPFRHLPVEGWPRRRSPRRIWVAAKLAVSVARSWRYLKRFQPQLVFGVGGYVSLPLLWTAQRMNIPTAFHEQNRLLGMANRILAPRGTRVFLSYADTRGDYPADRAIVTGNPVRSGFAHPPSKEEARRRFDLNLTDPVVLVSGGSQGARTLNRAMRDSLPVFRKRQVQFLWMTGPADFNEARAALENNSPRIRVFPFIDDQVAACAAADLIVSRAGASTTAEIAMMAKPSLLIPYPHATDNHQEHNARAFEDVGAARVLLDADCTAESLQSAIMDLFDDPDRLRRMARAASSLAKPGAAERIVEALMAILFADAAPV